MRTKFFFLLAFLPALLCAQVPRDKIFNSPLTEAKRRRFEAICAVMAAHPVARGDFVQTKTISRLGRTLVSRGVFTIARGEGMIWDTRSPYPSIMALGKDYLVEIAGGKKRRMDASGNMTFVRIAETMSAVFSGNIASLTANFEIYFAETERSWTLALVPKDGAIRQFAAAIIMEGESASSAVKSLRFYEQGGDTVSYELSNQTYAQTLNADEKACLSG
ncbi:MAG: outer membrane lipoprotein carrier protein LolA [Treponema sp.]|jgi:outer membrane lipoprotein-sorting protein|nr:outer membrane lipoprotein carrier protein LolA [Treponema sp.]